MAIQIEPGLPKLNENSVTIQAMIHIFIFILGFIIACNCNNEGKGHINNNPGAQKKLSVGKRYSWTKLSDSANWPKSYNFQMLSINDSLLVLHHDGVWISSDAKNWSRSPLGNPVNNQAFLDYIVWKDAIFGLGSFEGNIERFTNLPMIFRSAADLKSWDTIARKSNLPKRFFYHPFIFKNKVWLVGGEDGRKMYNDIWNSADGIKWIQIKKELPFGPRSHSKVVKFHDSLFLFNNDVWVSANGKDWTKRANEIIKGQEVFGYSVEVFDDQLWLIGCNRNGRFTSQVLSSYDGINWNGQEAPWSPRGAVASAVYKGNIYITGGKYGGTTGQPDFIYSNDLWALTKN